MTTMATILETAEYRVVLVQPNSDTVLALDAVDEYRFPRVRISRWNRPVRELCKAIQNRWGAASLILDILLAKNGSTSCVVAQLLGHSVPKGLRSIALDQILIPELTEEERFALRSILNGEMKNIFSRPGWIVFITARCSFPYNYPVRLLPLSACSPSRSGASP
jgi:hypothetical protein